MKILASILLALTLLTPERVSIDVYPRVVPVGSTLRLRCTVPRHKDNRILAYGIVDSVHSEIPWEGEDAPLTRTVFIAHMGCDDTEAYCGLIDVNGEQHIAFTHVVMGGCGDHGLSEANAASTGVRGRP